jgi:hypothetical protein
MPVGFATSPTTGQGFCFIAASWIWVGLEEKITVKLTKNRFLGLENIESYLRACCASSSQWNERDANEAGWVVANAEAGR